MDRIIFAFLLTANMLSSKVFAQNAVIHIRDVKPPVALPSNYGGWIILIILLLLILLIFIIQKYWRIRKMQAPSPEPVVLPWDRALSQLNQLEDENLPAQGRGKEFYVRLSDIVRHYIEERFSLRAPEMTTEEFLVSLKDSRNLNLEQKKFLQKFLNQCDMVKFAKHKATVSEMQESICLAKELVCQTKESSFTTHQP